MNRTTPPTTAPTHWRKPVQSPRVLALFILALLLVALTASGFAGSPLATAAPQQQVADQLHEGVFAPGPSFNVGEIIYPSAHDFDTTSGTDTCLSLSVPPGDTFTLSLEWEALFGDPTDAGDLDLYLYLDSSCTESALLTSSFNSNAYTGELAEVTPQVRNISSAPAVAGVRVGRRAGRGNPGQLRLRVLTGQSTFLEHGTTGPPLEGQEGSPVFQATGPFSIPENSLPGTVVGTVTATDPQQDTLTFFELEPAAGQTSFQVNPTTGQITVEDPSLLDREAAATVVYWVGVTDGTSASLAGIGVNLSGVNDNAPTALAMSVVTATDIPAVITLRGTDADIDPAQLLAMNITAQPVNGAVGAAVSQGMTSSSVVYTPSPGFIGTDSFTFSVNDGVTTSAPAIVTITVTDDPAQLPSPTPEPGPGTPVATTPTPPGNTIPGPTPTSTAVANPTPSATADPTPVSTPPTGGGSGGGSSVLPPPTSGAPSDQISPPSAPRFVRAEARDSSALLTWQRPIDNGGAPIDGYRIFNINTARSTLVPGDALEGVVPALENGTSYLFQVRAFNEAGFGEGALVGTVTPDSGRPVALHVRASVHPDDTISIWWSAPDDVQLEPIALYRLWTEAGELLEAIAPDKPLIANVKDLQGDTSHAFRVTASDADGELVATGVTDPVYLPPTLASTFEPLPTDAILVALTEPSREALQIALQATAGGQGSVIDAAAVLTVRGGEAQLFVHIEGLHRGLLLPPAFEVETEQLAVKPIVSESLLLDLEIAPEVRLSGAIDVFVDPSGILFKLSGPELSVSYTPVAPKVLNTFEITYSPAALSPGFLIQTEPSEKPPVAVNEALTDPLIRSVVGLTEVSRAGVELGDGSVERVSINIANSWHELQLAEAHNLLLFRVNPDGTMTSTEVSCEPSNGLETTECTGEFSGDSGEKEFYALAAVSDFQRPPATPVSPEPTVISAPIEPTVTAPALVVVKEPTVTTAPSPTTSAAFQPTSTPAEPVVPETGGGFGGATVVTWLMSGILGLVVIRGAFYAVGRLRA